MSIRSACLILACTLAFAGAFDKAKKCISLETCPAERPSLFFETTPDDIDAKWCCRNPKGSWYCCIFEEYFSNTFGISLKATIGTAVGLLVLVLVVLAVWACCCGCHCIENTCGVCHGCCQLGQHFRLV